jgi:hypothetical protein
MLSGAAQYRDGRLTGDSHFSARQWIFRVRDGPIATMTTHGGKAAVIVQPAWSASLPGAQGPGGPGEGRH